MSIHGIISRIYSINFQIDPEPGSDTLAMINIAAMILKIFIHGERLMNYLMWFLYSPGCKIRVFLEEFDKIGRIIKIEFN